MDTEVTIIEEVRERIIVDGDFPDEISVPVKRCTVLDDNGNRIINPTYIDFIYNEYG